MEIQQLKARDKTNTLMNARTKQLTVKDLKALSVPIQIQNDHLILERSPRGHIFKKPVEICPSCYLFHFHFNPQRQSYSCQCFINLPQK